uniref:Si:dkey-19b23.13 n=1 Tax=Neolamprologus brichardi TaxID=32507 RepID=A0A3Q4HSE6_NEOBR
MAVLICNVRESITLMPFRLNGCYEALEGGNTAEALINFTGGVSEPLSLDREALRLHSDQRRALFQTLTKVHECKSLITCSIRVRLLNWLKRFYTFLSLQRERPWSQCWSVGSSEQWQQLSRAERDKMGLVVRDVGEFWMDFEDFCQHFTDVVVCRLVERTLLWPRSRWREVNGVWKVELDKRSRCGGCINHRETFLHNPQFMFEVRAKEEEVLICLQQEDRRMWRKNGKGENLPIGFEVLKVEVNRCSRVQCVAEQAASSIYMDSRSVILRGTLTLGRYVVLPTTFLPGVTRCFLLRLFSHSRIRLRELREDLPSPSVLHCFLPQPTVVTTVYLHRASGLSPPKQTGDSPDVYAVVRCENNNVRTRVFKESGNPEFNLRTIFYRRYPNTDISVEIYSRGLLWDSLLGETRLQTAECERSRSLVMNLQGGRSRSGLRGCVYLETSSSVCLTDL